MATSVAVKKNSFLQFAELLTVDDTVFWDIVDLPVIIPQPDDLTYTVMGEDRIDLLAYRYYKNPILKWVIMAANNLEIEPTDIVEGMTLLIPAPRYVLQVLFTKAPQRRNR